MFTVKWLYYNFQDLNESLKYYVFSYLIITGIIPIIFVYCYGPLTNPKYINIIEWLIKLTSIFLIFMNVTDKLNVLVAFIFVFITFNLLYLTYRLLYLIYNLLYKAFKLLFKTYTLLYKTYTLLYKTYTLLFQLIFKKQKINEIKPRKLLSKQEYTEEAYEFTRMQLEELKVYCKEKYICPKTDELLISLNFKKR